MSCHRRDLNLNSFTTEMKPAAFSASSSSRISSISASTSSQPRSILSAKGGDQGAVCGWTTASPERGCCGPAPPPPPTGEPHPSWQLLGLSSEPASTWGSRGRMAAAEAADLRGSRSPQGGSASLQGTGISMRAGSNAPVREAPEPRLLPPPAPPAPSRPLSPVTLAGSLQNRDTGSVGTGPLSFSFLCPQHPGWCLTNTANTYKMDSEEHLVPTSQVDKIKTLTPSSAGENVDRLAGAGDAGRPHRL